MRLVLVTGGARSGKSSHAERLAAELGGDDVTYIATARADDEEMARRIERHRADRPEGWTTVETTADAGDAVREVATDVVLLDCMTMLASNALLDATKAVAGDATGGRNAADAELAVAAVRREAERLLRACDSRRGTLIVVTNEVGFGLVPATPLGRWYRDALGLANRRLAEAADEVVLMVSGIAVRIKPSRGRLAAPDNDGSAQLQ